MAYLMRMILPSRWTQNPLDIGAIEEINAEVACDLCADKNAISTWSIGNKTEVDIQKSVTAFISNFKTLDEITIVFIDEEELQAKGFIIKPTPGITKIKEYATLHRDINELKIGQLNKLADIILKNVRAQEVRAVPVKEMTLWLINVMEIGYLKFNDLEKSFRQGLAAKIDKLIKNNECVPPFDSLQPELQQALREQWAINKRHTNCPFEVECDRYPKKNSHLAR